MTLEELIMQLEKLEKKHGGELLVTTTYVDVPDYPAIIDQVAVDESERDGSIVVLMFDRECVTLKAAVDAGEAEGEYVGEHTEDISYKFDDDRLPERAGKDEVLLDSTGDDDGDFKAIERAAAPYTREGYEPVDAEPGQFLQLRKGDHIVEITVV
jgi:hypothetical protein